MEYGKFVGGSRFNAGPWMGRGTGKGVRGAVVINGKRSTPGIGVQNQLMGSISWGKAWVLEEQAVIENWDLMHDTL